MSEMFENIIGLPDVCRDLKRDITGSRLPGAILLSGPRYGGKSSIALEIARAVTCIGEAAWGCTCRSCSLHRSLEHPNTLMVGPRYFSQEITASAAAFSRESRQGTRFLVTRSVRKLVRRFDPHIWPETKVKKAIPLAESLEGLLVEFEECTDAALNDGGGTDNSRSLDKAERTLKKILSESIRLEQLLPYDPVPVDLVRALASWSYGSSSGGRQVVIVEEAHTLQDGARNAMLKILEEPPENTLFILTTSRRAAVIPTIRSRLRTYELPQRRSEHEVDVQRRIFRSETPSPSLRDFFREQTDADGESWSVLSRDLVQQLENGGSVFQVEHRLKGRLAASSPRHGAEYFLDALEEEIRKRLGSPQGAGLAPDVLMSWGPVIRRYWARIDSRNMNPSTVLSGLVLALRRSVEQE